MIQTLPIFGLWNGSFTERSVPLVMMYIPSARYPFRITAPIASLGIRAPVVAFKIVFVDGTLATHCSLPEVSIRTQPMSRTFPDFAAFAVSRPRRVKPTGITGFSGKPSVSSQEKSRWCR
jgi:hypothetical protein